MNEKGMRRLLDELVVTGSIDLSDQVAMILADVMGGLRDNDRRAVILRFGLEDGKRHTYDTVAKQWKPVPIKRQRVEQLVNRALRQLRYHTRQGRLKRFVQRGG
ncbi:hypothetical protein ACFLXE_00010 [Chloroflexota bacterium]